MFHPHIANTSTRWFVYLGSRQTNCRSDYYYFYY